MKMPILCQSSNSFFVAIMVVFVFLLLQDQAYGQRIRVVAITGQDASQAGPGATFGPYTAIDDGFYRPVINGSGQVAFRAHLNNPNVSGGRRQSIWHEANGALRLLAHQGLNAPGGLVWTNDFSNPTLNQSGNVAFEQSDSDSVWSEGPGSLSRIIRSGDPLQGAGTVQSVSNIHRDPASGRATGRRQFAPIKIRKRIDRASPLLAKALTQNSRCQGIFSFYRPDGEGNDEVFYTVTMEGAFVSDLVVQMPDTLSSPGQDVREAFEEVTFTFDKIIWEHRPGGTQHEDSWSGAK